jgi:hypothetical protein
MNIPVSDLIWGIIGFFLSVLVFSYLIGDNPLFRFAIHLFIGVSAGVVSVIILYQVLYPRLIVPFLTGSNTQRLMALIPLVLSLLLLFKVSPQMGRIGNIPSAYLLGAGAALTVGGVVLGTLIPQGLSAVTPFGKEYTTGEKLEGALILIAAISTLLYFYFGSRFEIGKPLKRPAWIEWSARIGQVFILITLGAIFAGVYVTAITALSERLITFWNLIHSLL